MVQSTIYKGIIDSYLDTQKMAVSLIENNKCKYTIGQLAEKLGISRGTFYRKMKDFNFTPEELNQIIDLLHE